jgi:O-antigen ligase
MSSRLALILCWAFILWLYARDVKQRRGVSLAVWIPFLWAAILGSRPVSFWLSGGSAPEVSDDYLEGSPMDRNFFLLLIGVGIWVLLKRRVQWNLFFGRNKILVVFYIFWGLSALWSDYTMVAFKRWIKEIGHVVMVLVILTEEDPVEAFKAVLARCSYVLIPLSVLFIRYIPDLGRFYTRWTWELMYTGITLEKNTLGNVTLMCGLFVLWNLLDFWDQRTPKTKAWEYAPHLLLLVMGAWLLTVAHSSTSIGCGLLGTAILLGLRLKAVRLRLPQLEGYLIGGALVLFMVQSVVDFKSAVIEGLGRDAGLTGRSDLWKELLHANINPLLGEGFYSFWISDIAGPICDNYYWHPNQAHNGYLDTYLNGGVLGVVLLLLVLWSSLRNIKQDLVRAGGTADLRLVYLFVMIIVNWTEAMFNKMSLGWFAMLLAMVDYPVAGWLPAGEEETDSDPAEEAEPEEAARPEAEEAGG